VLEPLTMGQTLSALMILGGIVVLLLAWREGRAPPPRRARAR
jgi:prolipoprotein diacylglyceryltransferase